MPRHLLAGHLWVSGTTSNCMGLKHAACTALPPLERRLLWHGMLHSCLGCSFADLRLLLYSSVDLSALLHSPLRLQW